MPDVTPSRYRSQANGVINFMGGFGALVSFFVGSKLFEINESYPFWMGSVLVIFASLLVILFVKETSTSQDLPREQTPGLFKSLDIILKDPEKSPLRMLLAILFWFISYNAIDAFFTLYAFRYLGLSQSESAFQLTFISLLFLIFALPAGFIGARIGRKTTIMIGILLLGGMFFLLGITPVERLTTILAETPLVGNLRVVGLLLMAAGVGWALININSLPMMVDMTGAARIGTYTGLNYFAATLAAIVGQNIFGLIVQLGGENYNLLMIFSPIFLVLALLMMAGIRRGEVKKSEG